MLSGASSIRSSNAPSDYSAVDILAGDRRYMHKYGIKEEEIAEVAVKTRATQSIIPPHS